MTADDSETFTIALVGDDVEAKKTPWVLILFAIGLGIALMLSG